MNIQRLEMMKQLLGRVVAGSWEPVTSLPKNERFIDAIAKVVVTSVDLKSWSNHKTGSPGGTCGFTACAVGHACFDEEFRKLGLKFDGSQPYFSTYIGWVAVEKFFNIDDRTAETLFMDRMYSYKIRNKYTHLPARHRDAQMVMDRIGLLLQYTNESQFNAYARSL